MMINILMEAIEALTIRIGAVVCTVREKERRKRKEKFKMARSRLPELGH